MKLFIMGQPGCGKTTFIKRFLEGYKGSVSGILTEDIRKKSVRTGFKICDIATGKEGILASIQQKEGLRISKYRVNIVELEAIALPALERKADLIVIDEIGAMELSSERFKTAVERILNSEQNVLATLHRNYVKNYANYGEVLILTRDNVKEVLAQIKQAL
jgi:nucleoside-triphosphatase